MDNKKYSEQIILNIVMLVFFVIPFLLGTFYDETMAEILFSPGNIVVKCITSTGVYPFFVAPVLFCGALCERAVHSDINKAVKAIFCTLCVITAVFVGFIGGGALADRNCFGMIFPSLVRNIPAIVILSMIFEYPMFLVGFRLAGKTEDKMLVKRIIALLVILIAAFVSMQVLKGIFNRPRYRTAVLGYEGVGFVPWYRLFSGAEYYVSEYGINADEFRSFPSGHSILSISAMYILPSLSWLFPKLKDKQLLLFLAGFVFGIMIMLTRMILGAHYLSDVSAGAIIGTLLTLVYTIIQLHISASHDNIT